MNNHILIVDDKLSMLLLLESILKNNYEVTVKKNAYEAVQWLEEGNRPDLILLDMEIAYFTGPEFVTWIKSSGMFSNIPIIALTNKSDNSNLPAQVLYAIEKFFKKPFDPSKLKHAISTLLPENARRSNDTRPYATIKSKPFGLHWFGLSW